jgi:predicted glycosyltransferase
MTRHISARRGPRIALYSHDTMGFGHVRRNILIAKALAALPLRAEVLLIAGMREAGAFTMPLGVDCLTLPAWRKDESGAYRPRSLACDPATLVSLRSATIEAALRRFDPDLFIVDNVPRGAMDELSPALQALRRRGRTQCVLGLRDVLDEPEAVHRQWRKQRAFEAVRRHYDAIWVYGDGRLYDTAAEYGFDADIRAKLRYAGYLDQSARLLEGTPAPQGRDPYVLCAVGGGQDGARVTIDFAEAGPPDGHRAVIVAGSFMPADARARLAAIAARDPRLTVLDFVSDASSLLHGAARAVTMGGYNTVMEVLSFGRPALIVPRVAPRREQIIRAERLAALGLVDMLHPDDLSAERLRAWLRSDSAPSRPARELLDLDGLARLPRFVEELLAARGTQPRLPVMAGAPGKLAGHAHA